MSARSLAAGRAMMIGVAYNNPSSGYLNELLWGALRTCRANGHNLVVEELSVDAVDNPDAAAARLRDSGLDGIIIASPLSNDAALSVAIREVGVRQVLVSPGPQSEPATKISIDDRAAAERMTRHLVELGHRTIGFIEGAAGSYQSEQRLAGFRSVLEEGGLSHGDLLVERGAYTYRTGMDAAGTLLNRRPDMTAIFAANDDMAAGAIAQAHRSGLRVPQDLSVAGFDDTSIARTVWPRLTTVRQPIAEMASRAVELLDRMGPELLDQEFCLDVAIVERESVGPAPDRAASA